MSAQDKLDRRAAKHGLGSDERKRKIQKAKDFFSKPVPTYSKDELRKMGHPVEATDAEVKKKQDFLDRLRGKPPVKKESSAEYGKSMDRIKDKEKNAAIKPKDRETLGKLADLMKKQKRNEEVSEISQATKQRYTDKVVKKLTTKRGSRDHDAYTGRTYTGRETGDMFHRGAKLDKHLQRVKKLDTKINVPEEKMYSVKYTHPTDKKSGKTTGPLSKAAADKKAAMGNRVDRVGGKYTVIPHVEAAGQEYTAVPIKTGDVSQADRLTIAKMDAIMKKRSKDKRQKEQNIHFVKVGDGRDHIIVKTKADKPSDAVKKIKSQYPKDRVRLHKEENESVSSADKKPQNFRDPATGKLKVRMVPVDRDVVRGDDKARVVRKKRFKNMRKEQMATGNSRVGKDGRDAFMKAFKDVQKTAAEIQKKKDADKK